MTNNLDLGRDLLLKGETSVYSSSDPKIVYHLGLMRQAGLVHAMVTPNKCQGRFTLGILKRLTPPGRQFLHAARNETIWRRAKQDFIRPGLMFSLSLVTDYLKHADHRTTLGELIAGKNM